MTAKCGRYISASRWFLRPTLVFTLVSAIGAVYAADCPVQPTPTPNDQARTIDSSKLNEEIMCKPGDPEYDKSPCNSFVVAAIRRLYGVETLGNLRGAFLANDMVDELERGKDGWKSIGTLLDQENSLCAQSLANSGYIVIAALKKPGNGHVAIVLPGEATDVGSWAMKVPNSASFFYDSKQPNYYIGKPLSYAFGRPDAEHAKYYYRAK